MRAAGGAVLVSVGVLLLAGCSGGESERAAPTPPTEERDALPVARCAAGASPAAPGPADQPRPALNAEWAWLPAAMDSQSGQIVAWAGYPGETWAFDVCTNVWRQARPPAEPTLGPSARLVYDAEADLVVGFARDHGGIWTYSVEANAWTQLPPARGPELPAARGAGPERVTDAVYDPDTGLVLAWADPVGDLWSYDLQANRWAIMPIGEGSPFMFDQHTLLAYDTVVDRAILVDLGTRTWTYDMGAQTWAPSGDPPAPEPNTGYVESGGEVAFDAAHGRTVIFSDGQLHTYDAAAEDWTWMAPGPGWPDAEALRATSTGPLARLGHSLVFDPVNERVVLLGGASRMAGDRQNLGDVWAYDLPTNTWTEIVAARPR